MSFISDEMLFITGIVITSVALLSAIIIFVIYQIKKTKLNADFDKEYGEESK